MLTNREIEQIMKSNGKRLRKIREGKKLTQRELSEKAGLLRCLISRIENGKTDYTIVSYIKYLKGLR